MKEKQHFPSFLGEAEVGYTSPSDKFIGAVADEILFGRVVQPRSRLGGVIDLPHAIKTRNKSTICLIKISNILNKSFNKSVESPFRAKETNK